MIEIGKTIIKFPPLREGILIKRYKRFLADVELDDGEIVTAHCANTGPMKGVLWPGGRVRLRYSPSPKRKLDWSWEQAEVPSYIENKKCWAGVNTSLPNKLIKHLIEANGLEKELGAISIIKPEVVYGKGGKSRIDLLLEPENSNLDLRKIYVEVKNTTWCDKSLALFPDTVTTRGQKHLKELMDVCPDSRAVLIPCISRKDMEIFAPGDSADPRYGELFRDALIKGLEVIPCSFGFFHDRISWEGIKPFREFQK
ncbi:DNA/RNA nuclease SfsA [Prochlorococcus marinus]|uniref:Sugar fermentation stimulation protein homolog n=1 Tax=Prochlorococcus marinus XMU1408 TaxID=2213228 RepID=A0A318R0C5_PROMR|nr:DNA/RNA nuclease SfsA [Prochlorococcus marinus]MBW3041320.1 DNA/RNA nuclease SfsA [Prochlorococcus marinus str. XMU1408]PYE02495.1 DNA/RNA nuclease SfsA [Prochlorococcus marinus XMU1408]